MDLFDPLANFSQPATDCVYMSVIHYSTPLLNVPCHTFTAPICKGVAEGKVKYL